MLLVGTADLGDHPHLAALQLKQSLGFLGDPAKPEDGTQAAATTERSNAIQRLAE